MASIGRNKQCRDCRFHPESRQCAVSKGEIDACFFAAHRGLDAVWGACGLVVEYRLCCRDEIHNQQ